jgi:hypothetical protein
MSHFTKLLSVVCLIVFLGTGLAAQENRDVKKTRAKISLKKFEAHTDKVINGRKYRYVMKHRFRKTKPGAPLRFVYLPVPPSVQHLNIFFTRHNLEGQHDIYWISSEIINSLRNSATKSR